MPKKIILLVAFTALTTCVFSQISATYQRAATLLEEAAKKYDALKCHESAAYLRKMRDWNNCMVKNLGGGTCGLEPLAANAPKCAAAMPGGGMGSSNSSNQYLSNNTYSDNNSNSEAVGRAIGLTIDLINQGKRNKWNKEYLRKVNQFEDQFGITIDALEKAVEDDDIDFMEMLIEKGFDLDVDIINIDETLLYFATEKNKLAIVKLLLEKGASVNKDLPKTPDRYAGLTPLHTACLNGNLEIVKLLVENGANLNAQIDFWRSTPIHLAIQKKRLDVIKYLKQKGADLTLTRKWESNLGIYKALTPIEYAGKIGFTNAIEILNGY